MFLLLLLLKLYVCAQEAQRHQILLEMELEVQLAVSHQTEL